MSTPEYRIERLTPDHDLGAFDCGEEYYNTWLVLHALEADARGTSAVYLLVRRGDGMAPHVCGYFAICPTTVRSDMAPHQIGRAIMRQAPGWLLAKLALDRSLRGGTWGRELLRAALEEIIGSADRGGGQVIVVDAENQQVFDWYGAQGFLSTGIDNLRLYMKVSTARKYLAP
ncbi:hypothetical protein ACX9R5_04080 [Rathayibacter sp. CAU 1779]